MEMRRARIRSVLIAIVCLALCGQVLASAAQFCLPVSSSHEASVMLTSQHHHASLAMSSKVAELPMHMEHHQSADTHSCCAAGQGCSMAMCGVLALPALDYVFADAGAGHPPYADLEVVAPELKTSSLYRPPIFG
jgi:hypothetical protein